jgi:hypothetical protein
VGDDVVPEDEGALEDERALEEERALEDEALEEGGPPSSDQIAAAADVLVTARTRRQLAATVAWNAMVAIALILTIASIALIVAGILGAHL